ncbi:hypothetical protein M378DRAFT_187149 [Amanita muscaria Koide BX008]|uniref:Uncharacterized protein n=1 Tax=Amanita muscaria (strain Koide BX008) TaxID=946122 RepID=A0A0C2X1P3_AMAMK|nr:hypothetical protein M378DRAFT_187149 [Amanita muscaria Koide BX008]
MTDLTVLISPTPLHIHTLKKSPFSFRRSTPCLITPVMVTLETEREGQEEEEEEDDKNEEEEEARKDDEEDLDAKNRGDTEADIPETSQPPAHKRRGRTRSRIILDPNFLSPPINTFTSRRSRHKPTRSQSAPPGGAVSRILLEPFEQTASPSIQKFIPISPSAAINNFNRRSFTSLVESSGGKRSNGDLLPPPPSLLRPTTFWRKTRRSGVTAASYSPSYHLIRRSTFVAAGLDFDTPSHDLRAYCVENRIGFIVVPPDCSFL